MQLALRNESVSSQSECLLMYNHNFFFFSNSFVPLADTKSASFKKEVMIFCQQDTRRGQYPGFLQASRGSVCSSFVLVWSNNHAALSQLMLRNRFHQHYLRCRKTIILCHQIESVSCFISHFINVGFSSVTACAVLFYSSSFRQSVALIQ